MLRIRLPFPDRELNPNVRKAWPASLKPKREAREVGYWAAMNVAWKDRSACFDKSEIFNDKPLCLRIAIHPPDNRRRDWINAVRAIKEYEDGIFDYLGMDDYLIRDVRIKMRRSCPEGMVRYILYQK